MTTQQEINNINTTEMPWLVFKLKNKLFAIKTDNIVNIFQINQQAIPMPEAPECIRGIINIRGEIVPLMELRTVLGMESFKQEQKDFYDMLDMRKQDHINWVKEFERCAKENDEFKLSTDPNECTFGKWLKSYKPTTQTIAFHLNKIEEPHRLLHETGAKATDYKNSHDSYEQNENLQSLVKKETDIYMPTVLNLLEETKEVFKNSYREMCIVIKKEDSILGILVDEVLCVDILKFFDKEENLKKLYKTEMVSHVANANTISGEILVLNQDKLFEYIK